MKVSDISRQYGIAEQTFYRWKSKYVGMEISEAKRLKQLEEENRRLKQLVGEQALDIQFNLDELQIIPKILCSITSLTLSPPPKLFFQFGLSSYHYRNLRTSEHI
jgi:putative transposase